MDWLLGVNHGNFIKTALLSVVFSIPILIVFAPYVLEGDAAGNGRWIAIAAGYPILAVFRSRYWNKRQWDFYGHVRESPEDAKEVLAYLSGCNEWVWNDVAALAQSQNPDLWKEEWEKGAEKELT